MENLEFIAKVVSRAFEEFKFKDIPTPTEFEKLENTTKDMFYRQLFNSASESHGTLFSLLEYIRLYDKVNS